MSALASATAAPAAIQISSLSVTIPSDPSLPTLCPSFIPITITSYSATSAHIWIGTPTLATPSPTSNNTDFGGLVASFPPTNSSTPTASSHLINSGDDDETVSAQISQRIAKRTNWPIFLSLASYNALSSGEADMASVGLIIAKCEKEIVGEIERLKIEKGVAQVAC